MESPSPLTHLGQTRLRLHCAWRPGGFSIVQLEQFEPERADPRGQEMSRGASLAKGHLVRYCGFSAKKPSSATIALRDGP